MKGKEKARKRKEQAQGMDQYTLLILTIGPFQTVYRTVCSGWKIVILYIIQHRQQSGYRPASSALEASL